MSTFRKLFITTFEDNDISPEIFKSIIAHLRTLNNDTFIKMFLNKKQYSKEYKDKTENDRFPDFLNYIIGNDVYRSGFVEVLMSTSLIDVFNTGSYNKIVDAINRVFFPRIEKDDEIYDLMPLISTFDMNYYGKNVETIDFKYFLSSEKDYFDYICNNRDSVCLSDGQNYYIFEPSDTHMFFNFSEHLYSVVRQHYFTIDSLKRQTNEYEFGQILNYLQLKTYSGESKEILDSSDELKLRNKISGFPLIYEDNASNTIAIFKINNDYELRICYGTTSEFSDSVFESENMTFTPENDFVSEWFNRTDDVLYYSLL